MERNERGHLSVVVVVTVATSDKPQNGSIYLHKHNHACELWWATQMNLAEPKWASFGTVAAAFEGLQLDP